MSDFNSDTVIQDIIKDLNITNRNMRTHSVMVSDAKEALNSIKNGLSFFTSIDEALCKHFDLNYKNIQKNNISVFDLIVQEYTYETEKNIHLSVHSLKDFYFCNSRGSEYTRGESLLVPLIEYYYNKHEDKNTILDINGTESLKYKIYEFDNFKIITGGGCCNHRLYGIAKSFYILKDTKMLIRELVTAKVISKESSLYNYITKDLLVKLSNGEFVMSKLEKNKIEIVSNNVMYYWALYDSTIHFIDNQEIINFFKNIKFYDKISTMFNIKNIMFFEKVNGDIEVNCSSINDKDIKLIFDKDTIDRLYDLGQVANYGFTKLIKFSIHYMLGFYKITDNKLVLKNIKDKEEITYYLNKAFKLLK